jgi:hypothetical protein
VTMLADFLNPRWLVSRKRTTNLFDVSNMWKREVLALRDTDFLSDDYMLDD